MQTDLAPIVSEAIDTVGEQFKGFNPLTWLKSLFLQEANNKISELEKNLILLIIITITIYVLKALIKYIIWPKICDCWDWLNRK